MNEKIRTEYIKWFSEQEWDWFWTGTFREEKSWDGTIRGRYTANSARRAAERFYKGFPGLNLACLFIESGEMYGKIHLHGLLRFSPAGKPTVATLSNRWFDKFGFNRLEPPRSLEDVSGYCSKYITKHAKDETYIIL